MDALNLTAKQIKALIWLEEVAARSHNLFHDKDISNETLQEMKDLGFLEDFGKVFCDYAGYDRWIKLSEKGWATAAELRKARSNLAWENRTWQTQEEGVSLHAAR